MAIRIDEETYVDAMQNDLGWCVKCKDFTREMCEPDARKYKCPKCEFPSVFGAEEAMMMGLFEFNGED